jgi:hypothetical protein
MSGKLKLTFALAVVAAGGVAAVTVTRGDASRDTAALSNHGGPSIAVRGLSFGVAPIRTGHLLGVRTGHAFYRLDRASGDPCYAVGAASDLGTPGSVVCPRGGFPASGSPVLDLSVYEGTRRDVREFGLYKVAGLAADGVASVQFFRPDGSIALTVPVSRNVYAATDVPEGPVVGLAALDQAGNRLWRSP